MILHKHSDWDIAKQTDLHTYKLRWITPQIIYCIYYNKCGIFRYK